MFAALFIHHFVISDKIDNTNKTSNINAPVDNGSGMDTGDMASTPRVPGLAPELADRKYTTDKLGNIMSLHDE